ncbi:MAG: galactose oxidase early set domain-containing protein [Fluviicola sp.]|nr:galactose oxidase early set domain-containing protein [Fluviicola sp.]
MATFEITNPDSEILAIHAVLLPTGSKGQVLIMGGDEHNFDQAGRDETPATVTNVDNSRIYDVASKNITYISSPTTDIFCSGHAFLGDGRLLIGGGTESWELGGDVGPGGGHDHSLGQFGGHQACWVFNYIRKTWERVSDFNFDNSFDKTGGGRWYPTLVSLSNGDVMAFSGHPSRRSDHWHNNDIPERYSLTGNNWQWIKPTDSEITFYPRVHLLKGGKLFICSVEDGTSRLYDATTGDFGASITGPTDGLYTGWDNSSVLLPLLPAENHKPIVLMTNGNQPIKIDLSDSTPVWENAGTRTGAAAGRERRFAYSTILPDGKILINGGIGGATNNDANAVLQPEIYDPGINWTTGTYSNPESWVSLPADPNGIVRNYHSTSLLLPDGSVFTAGSSINSNSGNPDTAGEKRIEVIKPDYFDNPARPDLTAAPKSVTYNQQFDIGTTDSSVIQRVAIIRNGTATHALNADQRYIGLAFEVVNSTTLRVRIPSDASVVPPGYYMLWIIDNAGLPCKLAKFIRIANQNCEIITDRSTFSVLEVDAQPAGNAIFQNAFYVVYDGFIPSELNDFVVPPTISFTDATSNAVIPGMNSIHVNTLYEDPSLTPDVPQKVTFVFNVRFSSNTAFTFAGLSRNVTITANLIPHKCTANINLIKAPNPYMVDGPTSWLSVDLRVFQMREGGPTRATIPQGNSGTTFINQLLTRFNNREIYPTDELHPFNDISIDQQTSQLEWLETNGGSRVFNYAIAKVRFKAPIPLSPPLTANDATDVRVFFRMFNTAGTAMQFNPLTTYKRGVNEGNTIAVVGKEGSEISSIPFFASPRVNYGTKLMASQTDSQNVQTIPALGNTESVFYFGCWLDFNQPAQQIPISEDATHATSLANLQTSIRGIHQCLVAEVFFPGDPTPTNATPSSSDNLSQRNLAIDHSDNPGSLTTHTVHHTFEIKPSQFDFSQYSLDDTQTHSINLSSKGGEKAKGPDLLMIHWNNLPRESKVILYMPDLNTDDILQLESHFRFSPSKITKEDEHTFSFLSADINYIPIPGGFEKNIPGLLTIELPSTVVKGQLFKVLVQQARYYRETRYIIGSFQFNVVVSVANVILKKQMRNLSILKHVRESLAVTNPWRLIFNRYIQSLSDKVNGLGGDADEVPAATDDRWLYNTNKQPSKENVVVDFIKKCCAKMSVLIVLILLILLALLIVTLLN